MEQKVVPFAVSESGIIEMFAVLTRNITRVAFQLQKFTIVAWLPHVYPIGSSFADMAYCQISVFFSFNFFFMAGGHGQASRVRAKRPCGKANLIAKAEQKTPVTVVLYKTFAKNLYITTGC